MRVYFNGSIGPNDRASCEVEKVEYWAAEGQVIGIVINGEHFPMGMIRKVVPSVVKIDPTPVPMVEEFAEAGGALKWDPEVGKALRAAWDKGKAEAEAAIAKDDARESAIIEALERGGDDGAKQLAAEIREKRGPGRPKKGAK